MENPTKTLLRNLCSEYFPLISRPRDNRTVWIHYILELARESFPKIYDGRFPFVVKEVYGDWVAYTAKPQYEFPEAYYTDILIELIDEYQCNIESEAEKAENLRNESASRTAAIIDLSGRIAEEETTSSDSESFVDSINPWLFCGSAVIAGIAITAGAYFFSKRKA